MNSDQTERGILQMIKNPTKILKFSVIGAFALLALNTSFSVRADEDEYMPMNPDLTEEAVAVRSHRSNESPAPKYSPETSYASPADDNYDRLDGHGKSRKKVDVVEWEDNLEIHVYPGGSLKGLGLKVIENDQKKKVMVIAYRFDTLPSQQIVRRAILGIPLREKFNVFRDPSTGSEYDKIIISNHKLSGKLVAYQLEKMPKELFPEGHPENNPEEKSSEKSAVAKSENSAPPRASSESISGQTRSRTGKRKAPAARVQDQPAAAPAEKTFNSEDGSVKSFDF